DSCQRARACREVRRAHRRGQARPGSRFVNVAAVVTAAGSGSRLGRAVPKALVPIAGSPMLAWAVATVAGVAKHVVVSAPGESVVTAAGSGSRLGHAVPKALVPIAGARMLAWAVSTVAGVAKHVVVTAPAESVDGFRAALSHIDAEITVVPGGENRQESVSLG